MKPTHEDKEGLMRTWEAASGPKAKLGCAMNLCETHMKYSFLCTMVSGEDFDHHMYYTGYCNHLLKSLFPLLHCESQFRMFVLLFFVTPH